MTKSEGIEAFEKGSALLESLYAFRDLDPLLTQTTNDVISLTNLDEDEREAFTNLCAKKVTTAIFT